MRPCWQASSSQCHLRIGADTASSVEPVSTVPMARTRIQYASMPLTVVFAHRLSADCGMSQVTVPEAFVPLVPSERFSGGTQEGWIL